MTERKNIDLDDAIKQLVYEFKYDNDLSSIDVATDDDEIYESRRDMFDNFVIHVGLLSINSLNSDSYDKFLDRFIEMF